MFYLNSTLNFEIPTVLVFQLEVYYNVDRLLDGLNTQPKGTTARWYSIETSLHYIYTTLYINLPYWEGKNLETEMQSKQKMENSIYVIP